ncbi:hypothetical protein [Streptosporangium sp. LJ11]|uniref:hypothetical protein n=1 Tax=Streptosporangium sp. LJ11 TaxID=3436927 RepID=UPI003F7A2490
MILGLLAPAEESTLTFSEWRCAGSGHRHGEPFRAEVAGQRVVTAREIAKERTHREME